MRAASRDDIAGTGHLCNRAWAFSTLRYHGLTTSAESKNNREASGKLGGIVYYGTFKGAAMTQLMRVGQKRKRNVLLIRFRLRERGEIRSAH